MILPWLNLILRLVGSINSLNARLKRLGVENSCFKFAKRGMLRGEGAIAPAQSFFLTLPTTWSRQACLATRLIYLSSGLTEKLKGPASRRCSAGDLGNGTVGQLEAC